MTDTEILNAIIHFRLVVNQVGSWAVDHRSPGVCIKLTDPDLRAVVERMHTMLVAGKVK